MDRGPWIEWETVHALVHNKYQGNRYPGCDSHDYVKCWYNTITHARSDDAGASFDRLIPAPDHLVASIPQTYAPDEGIFSPSNIFERDGVHHAFIKVQSYPFGAERVCPIRT